MTGLPEAARKIAVVVRSASRRNGRCAEALRGAVGLAAAGHRVRVLLVEDGTRAPGLGDEVDRALATLRMLEHEIMIEKESLAARELSAPPELTQFSRADLPRLIEECDVVEAWR